MTTKSDKQKGLTKKDWARYRRAKKNEWKWQEIVTDRIVEYDLRLFALERKAGTVTDGVVHG